jgi:hypothetical protein
MAELMKRNDAYLAEVKPEIDKLLYPPGQDDSGEAEQETGGLEPATAQTPFSQGMEAAGPVTVPFALWKDDKLVVKIKTRYRATYYGWPCAVKTTADPACTAASMEATIDCMVSFTVDKDGSVANAEKTPPERSVKSFPPPMAQP